MSHGAFTAALWCAFRETRCVFKRTIPNFVPWLMATVPNPAKAPQTSSKQRTSQEGIGSFNNHVAESGLRTTDPGWSKVSRTDNVAIPLGEWKAGHRKSHDLGKMRGQSDEQVDRSETMTVSGCVSSTSPFRDLCCPPPTPSPIDRVSTCIDR